MPLECHTEAEGKLGGMALSQPPATDVGSGLGGQASVLASSRHPTVPGSVCPLARHDLWGLSTHVGSLLLAGIQFTAFCRFSLFFCSFSFFFSLHSPSFFFPFLSSSALSFTMCSSV